MTAFMFIWKAFWWIVGICLVIGIAGWVLSIVWTLLVAAFNILIVAGVLLYYILYIPIRVVCIPLGLAVGMVSGIFGAIGHFFGSCSKHLGERTGRVEGHARVRYFHWNGDWWANFGTIWRETWAKCRAVSAGRRSRPPGKKEKSVADLARDSFSLGQGVGAPVPAAVLLPILFVLLGAVMVPVWVAYAAVSVASRGASWTIDRLNGLYILCRACHRKAGLPVYVCPRCGVEHRHLVPTAKFGPFGRVCECGAKLPTMWLLGRSRLKAVCPHCGRPMDDGKYAPACVAFVGGPSVGKSQLMMATVAALQERVARRLGRTLTVPREDAGKVAELMRDFRTGIPPGATRDAAIEAVCLELKEGGAVFPQRFYFYDPPGESFRSAGKVLRHKYYEHLRAVVFVADPSAMPGVRDAYDDAGVKFGVRQRGAQTPEESFQRWQIAMEQEYPGLVGKTVCALVVGKADERSMKRVTGLKAGDGDAACRLFLRRHGEGNLLSALESHFREVRTFAVGSVGNGGGGKAFAPVGVDAMLEWVLKKV